MPEDTTGRSSMWIALAPLQFFKVAAGIPGQLPMLIGPETEMIPPHTGLLEVLNSMSKVDPGRDEWNSISRVPIHIRMRLPDFPLDSIERRREVEQRFHFLLMGCRLLRLTRLQCPYVFFGSEQDGVFRLGGYTELTKVYYVSDEDYWPDDEDEAHRPWTQDEIEAVRRLNEATGQLRASIETGRRDTNQRVLLALRWFSAALFAWDHLVRLVALTTGLEALFGLSAQELSYRLSIRIACFLRRKREEQGETFELCRRLYDERSRILHAGAAKADRRQGMTLLRDGERLLAGCLLRILTDPEEIARFQGDNPSLEKHLDAAFWKT